MKLLIIAENMPHGGVSKVLNDILHQVDYHKQDITLLLRKRKDSNFHIGQLPKNVKVRSIPGVVRMLERRLHKTKQSYATSFMEYYLKKFFRGHIFDVIISFNMDVIRLHSYLLPLGKKHLSWVHGDLSNQQVFNNQTGRFPYPESLAFYNKIDGVLHVSQVAQDSFQRIYNSTTPQHVIYNICDQASIRKQAVIFTPTKRRFTVCTVARLSEEKCLDRVIHIAKILKERGEEIDFWIIGGGPEEHQLRTMATDLGVNDYVSFMGMQNNPYPYIKASDLFLLTSQTEAAPLVVIESMALKTPVVSTDIPAVRELIENGGSILSPHDNEALADAIQKVYHSATLRDELKEKCLQVCSKHAPEECMRRINALL